MNTKTTLILALCLCSLNIQAEENTKKSENSEQDIIFNDNIVEKVDNQKNIKHIKDINQEDFLALPEQPKNPKADVLGVDLNNDGIRDEVELKIYEMFPNEKLKRELSRRTAKVYQDIIVENFENDLLKTKEVYNRYKMITFCYEQSADLLEATKDPILIRLMTFDTNQRLSTLYNFKEIIKSYEFNDIIESNFRYKDCFLK